MSAKETALWLLNNLRIIHTGFDVASFRELIEGLDDRFIKLDSSKTEATIQVPCKNSYYTISIDRITKVEQYFGGTRTASMVKNLESAIRRYDNNARVRELIFDKLQDRIDDLYIGIKQLRDISELEQQYAKIISDIYSLEAEAIRADAIDKLQKAGFTICKETKEIIVAAIDDFIAKNEITINDLD